MVAVPEDFDRGFEEAYRAHYPALRRRSRRWLPADEVDDAVQETFLRAWAHHGGRDPGMGWLVTVLRNLAIDRARRRTAEPVGDIEKLDSPTDEGPDDKVVALEERRAVRQAMLDLTESQRTVLHLREWDGKSHQEIADSLGTTIPSVESLLVRGRRRLRGALEKVMGVVLWPASGAWRKLRGLPEAGAGAAVNPVAVGAVSTAVAHFATAAAVIVAGVAGGGGSGRGEEREPIRPSEGYTAAVAGGSEQVGSRRGASAGFTRETSSTKETARGSTSGGGSTASTETS
ncbi:MAG TPA: sigma-70 family RNA polymerase sigma factor, partial [Actinomycetota bacterium]|nr:sigma-70 family RNA polymerase sigma factor [Actinomycetota bacterium]